MTDQSIYLVRHGETAFNADGRLRGRADPDLKRRRSRPGKIVGVRFRVRTNFEHGRQ